MMQLEESLQREIQLVQQLDIVPTILEVICQTTDMGFAAVARVTKDKWIACSVLDKINFGLQPGGELQIETTICNEIRDSGKAVVIDNVPEDEQFCNHHTPKMYGFKSYISIPIFLKSGIFFGTLCAIDPRPASLKNPKTIGMFTLFADLIAFYLKALDEIEINKFELKSVNRQLVISKEENQQYQHISSHTLQEPLRKIQLYSDMLSSPSIALPQEQVKNIAAKINTKANQLSQFIKELADFTELDYKNQPFELVDLNQILNQVLLKLAPDIAAKNAVIDKGALPKISAIRSQIILLFYHLLHNALQFSKPGETAVIKVHSKLLTGEQVKAHEYLNADSNYYEVCVEDDGIGIDKTQLERIFNLFTTNGFGDFVKASGVGLAQCKKIVSNHGGIVTANSIAGKGSAFSIILPATATSQHS